MIKLDDTTKQRLSRFIGSDGKIIVSDDMPDDLKAAINYMNSNNISLLSEVDPLADEEESDDDDSAGGYSTENLSSTTNFTPQVNISEDDDIDVDDLEDLF